MAVTAHWYGNGLKAVASGSVAWATDTIKVAAVTSGYTPDQANNANWSDVVANEVASGNGYTTGGATLGTKSVVLTTETVSLRAAATTWTPAAGQTLTIHYLVIYKSTGTNTTSTLLGYVDLGADTSATGANWTATWDATDGVLKLTAA